MNHSTSVKSSEGSRLFYLRDTAPPSAQGSDPGEVLHTVAVQRRAPSDPLRPSKE